jgi:acyl-CoA reductase-like NAD-dependent aldehyde dehydrogenase
VQNALKFYIDGSWVQPSTPATLEVINPATEQPFATIAAGTAADVDRAVTAAKAALPSFSRTSKSERLDLLQGILRVYSERSADIARAISEEMGAPMSLARGAQTFAGQAHLEATMVALERLEFEQQRGSSRIVNEAIGVVGLITPWNWPLSQIVCKVAPVPRSLHDRATAVAKRAAEALKVGDPKAEDADLGPVVSKLQFERIQRLIEIGVAEGATLVTGGVGRPPGLDRGFYVRPTVFGNVRPEVTLAREEIFGPVLSVMPYDSEAEAITIANDSIYGLAAYVQSNDSARAVEVARQIRAGQVNLNYADWDALAPFGGYKQSGNGRECGDWGIHEFLELKAIIGGRF